MKNQNQQTKQTPPLNTVPYNRVWPDLEDLAEEMLLIIAHSALLEPLH